MGLEFIDTVNKNLESINEIAISNAEKDFKTALSEAREIANEIWHEPQEYVPPDNDEASLEKIVDEAWKIETRDVKGTMDNPRYISTRNEALENKCHPKTGVEFVRKVVELQYEVIEGVFPKFETFYDAILPETLLLETDKVQFKECNRQLANAIENNPDLKAKFTPEQIEQIYDGITDGTAPDGYVWHHNEETGIMQLVKADIHRDTAHTGGKSLWGGGKVYR